MLAVVQRVHLTVGKMLVAAAAAAAVLAAAESAGLFLSGAA